MTVSPVASVSPADRAQEVQSQARADKSEARTSESKARSQQPDDTVQLSPAAAAALHGPDADRNSR